MANPAKGPQRGWESSVPEEGQASTLRLVPYQESLGASKATVMTVGSPVWLGLGNCWRRMKAPLGEPWLSGPGGGCCALEGCNLHLDEPT